MVQLFLFILIPIWLSHVLPCSPFSIALRKFAKSWDLFKRITAPVAPYAVLKPLIVPKGPSCSSIHRKLPAPHKMIRSARSAKLFDTREYVTCLYMMKYMYRVKLQPISKFTRFFNILHILNIIVQYCSFVWNIWNADNKRPSNFASS